VSVVLGLSVSPKYPEFPEKTDAFFGKDIHFLPYRLGKAVSFLNK
jgi:hypothetical protein